MTHVDVYNKCMTYMSAVAPCLFCSHVLQTAGKEGKVVGQTTLYVGAIAFAVLVRRCGVALHAVHQRTLLCKSVIAVAYVPVVLVPQPGLRSNCRW